MQKIKVIKTTELTKRNGKIEVPAEWFGSIMDWLKLIVDAGIEAEKDQARNAIGRNAPFPYSISKLITYARMIQIIKPSEK